MSSGTPENIPDPIDVDVGARVRAARKLKGLSQQALAEAIGVTFQQVQKYERGANRISASMLARIAKTLNVRIADMFGETLNAGDGKVLDDVAVQFFGTEGGARLAENYLKLPRGHRNAVGNFIQELRTAAEAGR